MIGSAKPVTDSSSALLGHALDSLLNRGAPAESVHAAWPPNTHLLDTRSGTLRLFDTGGRGPAIVMAPDGPNVIEHHLPVIERLAPHARVICFDLPGFGFSRPALGYTHALEQGAGAILDVMDALDVREATLAFSCANGFYAIAAARLAPARVRQLVLCQTPSRDAMMQHWMPRNVPWPVQTPVLGQLVARANRRRLAETWYGIAVPNEAQRQAFKEVADRALTDGGCFCFAGVVQGLHGARNESLSGVKAPVTLFWGDADRSHKHTRAESLLDLLPQADIRHLPGCGHFPELEQHAAYCDKVLALVA